MLIEINTVSKWLSYQVINRKEGMKRWSRMARSLWPKLRKNNHRIIRLQFSTSKELISLVLMGVTYDGWCFFKFVTLLLVWTQCVSSFFKGFSKLINKKDKSEQDSKAAAGGWTLFDLRFKLVLNCGPGSGDCSGWFQFWSILSLCCTWWKFPFFSAFGSNHNFCEEKMYCDKWDGGWTTKPC